MSFNIKYILGVSFVFVLVLLSSCEGKVANNFLVLDARNIVNMKIEPSIKDLGIITITNKKSIKSVLDWLKAAHKPSNIGSYIFVEHSLFIYTKNNKVLHLKISSPGLGYTTIKFSGEILITDKYPELKELAHFVKYYKNIRILMSTELAS